MTDISELIERVRAATGPDRELDEAIRFYFDPKGSRYYSESSAYTASIDAALALVERCLPGCGYVIGMGRETPDEPLGACAIYSGLSGDSKELAEEEAPTLPLAILLALLTALQSTHFRTDEMTEVSNNAWPLAGYAPGNYLCICRDCAGQFEGDKRAFRCIECAANTLRIRAEAAEQQVRDMRVGQREAFMLWVRAWAKKRFGVWITHNTAKGAFAEYQESARLLLKEGGE